MRLKSSNKGKKMSGVQILGWGIKEQQISYLFR